MTLPTLIALRAGNGRFVSALLNSNLWLLATATVVGPWEVFTLIDLSDGLVALQAANGLYVCAENAGGQPLVANRTTALHGSCTATACSSHAAPE